jgi:hypothetical protein
LDEPKPIPSTIVKCCDVVLVPLIYWQTMGAPQPATVIATGVVLAIRKAAMLPGSRSSG